MKSAAVVRTFRLELDEVSARIRRRQGVTPLPMDEDFELPAGEQTAIAPLHAWRLSEEDEERVESALDDR